MKHRRLLDKIIRWQHIKKSIAILTVVLMLLLGFPRLLSVEEIGKSKEYATPLDAGLEDITEIPQDANEMSTEGESESGDRENTVDESAGEGDNSNQGNNRTFFAGPEITYGGYTSFLYGDMSLVDYTNGNAFVREGYENVGATSSFAFQRQSQNQELNKIMYYAVGLEDSPERSSARDEMLEGLGLTDKNEQMGAFFCLLAEKVDEINGDSASASLPVGDSKLQEISAWIAEQDAPPEAFTVNLWDDPSSQESVDLVSAQGNGQTILAGESTELQSPVMRLRANGIRKNSSTAFTVPWDSSQGMGYTSGNSESWWPGISSAIRSSGVTIGTRQESGSVKDPWGYDCSSYFCALANGSHGGQYPDFSGSGNTEWIYSNYLNPNLGKCTWVASGYAGTKTEAPTGSGHFTSGILQDGDIILFYDASGKSKHIAIACSGGFAYDEGTGRIRWNNFYYYMGWLRYGNFSSSASVAPYWSAYRPVKPETPPPPSPPQEKTWLCGLAIKKVDMQGNVISDSATFSVTGPDGFNREVTTSGGYAYLGGLAEGNYQVQETVPPSGYCLNGTVHNVTLHKPASLVKDGTDVGGVFQEADYLKYNSDLAGIALWTHFHAFIWNGSESRRSSSSFDIQAYRDINPDVAGSNQAVMLHYLNYGDKEGRRALTYDEIFRNGSDAAVQGVSVMDLPRSYYGSIILKKQARDDASALPGASYEIKGLDPGVNDSIDYKLETDSLGMIYMTGLPCGNYSVQELAAPAGYNVDSTIFQVEVKASNENRFLLLRDGDAYYMDAVFDPAYYASQNADVKESYGDGSSEESAKLLYEHFIAFGMKEGRDASINFHLPYYYQLYPDLQNKYGPIYMPDPASPYYDTEHKDEYSLNNEKYYLDYVREGQKLHRYGNVEDVVWDQMLKSISSGTTSYPKQTNGIALDDTRKKGDIQLWKYAIDGNSPLEGVDFQISAIETEKAGETVDPITIRTDSNGYATTRKEDGTSSLPTGKYKVQELRSDGNGDNQLEKEILVSITEDGQMVTAFDAEATGADQKIYNASKPGIKTKALVKETNSSTLSNIQANSICDEVTLSNLKSGSPYTLVESLKLVDGEGKISDYEYVDENPIQIKFTTNEKYQKSLYEQEHILEATFTGVDASKMPEGSKLVVYSALYYGDLENETKDPDSDVQFYPILHRDPNLESQTLYLPSIHTSAYLNNEDEKSADAVEVTKVEDKVVYENLLLGNEYVLTAHLMKQEDESPVKVNGEELTVTKQFIAKEKTGQEVLTFDLKEPLSPGKYTVYEYLYTKDGVEIAKHDDIHSDAQTVEVKKRPPVEKVSTEEVTTSREEKPEPITEGVSTSVPEVTTEEKTETSTQVTTQLTTEVTSEADESEGKEESPKTGDRIFLACLFLLYVSICGIVLLKIEKKKKK